MEIYKEFLINFLDVFLPTIPVVIVISLSMVLLHFLIELFSENPELAVSIGVGSSIGLMLMFLL